MWVASAPSGPDLLPTPPGRWFELRAGSVNFPRGEHTSHVRGREKLETPRQVYSGPLATRAAPDRILTRWI